MVSAFFKKEKVKYPSRSFKMNDPSLFHWDFLRQQPAISMAPTFMDIRAKDLGVEHAEGMSSVGARILELRKEKSRDAARSRRGKENYEFYELAKLLPLPAAITSQLDKASIIRLSISYLKLRDFSGHGDPPWNREGMPPNKSVKGGPLRRRSMTAVAMEMFETHQGTHILQSLDGFAFSLANDGRFLYISETVSIYLGLSQVEMTGSSIFDYVHQQDHPELADQLGLCIPQGTCTTTGGSIPSPGSNSDESSTTSTPRSITPPLVERATVMNPNPNKGYNRAFCLRMKSTLTKRGVHVKTSGYRVVHIVGHFRPQMTFTMNRKHPAPLLGMVALALAMPPPTITELRIESDVFITRLNPEFRVLYCEPIIADLMDLSAEDLTHKMLYDFCHAGDLQKLRKVHTDLLAKGQVLSEYYRLLNKHGGYIWLQTCATTICNAKNVEDQNIIAINYVLSGVEYGNCVLDANQLHTGAGSENDHSDHTDHSENGSDYDESHLKNKKSSDHKEGSLKVNQNNSCLSQSDRLKQPISEADDSLIDSGMQKCDLNCNNVYQDEESAKIVLNNRCCSIYAERSDASKVDSKNSRRKADKPRRRRREHENEDDGFNGSELLAEQKDGGSTKVPRLVRPAEEKSPVGKECHVGLVRSQDKLTSVPEDLSTKPIHSGHLTAPGDGHSGDWTKTIDSDHHDYSSVGQHTSVKDLEEVMNRHLPAMTDNPESVINGDISSRYLRQKPTIQWIGSHPSGTDSLPASNLLRTLYANRESVIRSNVCNTRPQYYSDIPISMLTPPSGGDGYKEQTTHIKTGKTPESYVVVSSYTTTPLSVSMSNSLSDSYNITPPSSVSPQDKLPSPFAEGGFVDSTTQCGNLGNENLAVRIPIKPQAAYTLPITSEYDHAKNTFPVSGNSYLSTNSEFTHFNHISNSSASQIYDSQRPTGPWYSASYSA